MEDKGFYMTETGVQLLSRLERQEALTDLEPALFGHEFGSGHGVEITGEAGVGKSQLLLHFVVRCIMPKTWQDRVPGGLQAGVVYVDNDHHLCVLRVAGLLEEALKRSPSRDGRPSSPTAAGPPSTPPSEEECRRFVATCLKCLYIVRCRSSAELLMTLQYVGSFVDTRYTYSLLVIDSISAFYWEDRMMCVGNLTQLDQHHQRLASAIVRLMQNDRIAVVFAKQDLMKPWTNDHRANNASSADTVEESNFMGHRIEQLLSWKIQLTKEIPDSCDVTATVRCGKGVRKVGFTIHENGLTFH